MTAAVEKCLYFIDQDAENIFSHFSNFAECSPSVLSSVLRRDSLIISSEKKLLDSLIEYANNTIENSFSTELNLRQFLVQNDLLWTIRYTDINEKDVLEAFFLTAEEKVNIRKFTVGCTGIDVPFSTVPRQRGIDIVRLPVPTSSGWGHNGSLDAVQVSFNRNIFFKGVTLSGPKSIDYMQVDGYFKLVQATTGATVVEHHIQSTIATRDSGLFVGFPGVSLNKDQWYDIQVCLNTPSPCRKFEGGQTSQQVQNLKIFWGTSKSSKNGTAVDSGQIWKIHVHIL